MAVNPDEVIELLGGKAQLACEADNLAAVG
jgi:hypothetical protein